MVDGKQIRWILAFDASCGDCRSIAASVDQTCDGRLEVLPLAHVDVQRWRAEALGADSEWAPTLLRTADRVRAWTGPSMLMPLLRRLGPVSAIRVVQALGELKRRADGRADELPGGNIAIGRQWFLRLAAGAGVAAGLVLAGRSPAFAGRERQTAEAWAHAHRNELPENYSQIVEYPLAYRRAIFNASSPTVRSRLWVEHLNSYRESHPHLSADQVAVLDRATQFAADPSTFEPGTDIRSSALELSHAAIATLGPAEAYRALAVLAHRPRPP